MQDPSDVTNTVIVVRGLVPGGAAHQDGRIIPGDRVMFVNETLLTQANLDLAVQALKGAPLGLVRVGVCKPRNIDGLNSQDSLARSGCGSLSVDGTAVSGELHTDTPVSQSVLYNEPHNVPL